MQREIRIADIGVVTNEGAHQGQADGGGEPFGGGRELTADLDVGLGGGEDDERFGGRGSRGAGVADEAHGPQAHIRIGVAEKFAGQRFIESAGEMQGPEHLEGELARDVARKLGPERSAQGGVAALGEDHAGGLAPPTVVMPEKFDEFGGGFFAEIEGGDSGLHADGPDAVKSAIVAGDLALVIAVVVDLKIPPIRQVKRAVGAVFDVHGAEIFVVGADDGADIARSERRAARRELGEREPVAHRIDGDEFSPISGG